MISNSCPAIGLTSLHQNMGIGGAPAYARRVLIILFAMSLSLHLVHLDLPRTCRDLGQVLYLQLPVRFGVTLNSCLLYVRPTYYFCLVLRLSFLLLHSSSGFSTGVFFFIRRRGAWWR